MSYRASFGKAVSLTSLAIVLASCESSVPTLPELSRVDDGNDERAALAAHVASLENMLRDGTFEIMAKGPDALKAAVRKSRVERDLAESRTRLATLPRGVVAHTEIENTEVPPCGLNLTLDACFLEWYTTLQTSGTGHVYQVSTVFAAQSATTFVTDNGAPVGNPVNSGAFLSSHSLSKDFSFPAPNCQSGEHQLYAATNHSMSISVREIGNISGNQASSARAFCAPTFLTVVAEKSTLGYNDVTGISITNLPPSCEPGAVSVTSSNGNVVFLEQYGTNWLAKSGATAGTASITARCPSGLSGSTSITVTGPADDNPDRYERSAGGGADASDCPAEYTYYHMRWNYGRNEYEWTGGVVCLPGETRTIIYLPVY